MKSSVPAMLQQNHMVKKHIATVHVEANLSFLERKMFNALLLNAYPNLLKKRRHKMRYSALCELIDYDSGDRKSIKNALKQLAVTQIEWIEHDEQGRESLWQVHNYLSSPKIKW